MSSTDANIARHLAAMAAARPHAPALKVPRGRSPSGEIDYLVLTFSELDREVGAWRSRFCADGIRRGDRALVMVRPGLPLIAAVFALFRIGAVPVVIDPGMKLRNFLSCVSRTRPRALVGIPVAQWISRIFRRTFKSVEVRSAVGASPTARETLARSATVNVQTDVAETARFSPSDLAAILFTSGSTGRPKGVCYEHGMFEAQVRLLGQAFAIEPGEVDLPLLPIFALFNPAFGMTTIVPEMDPRRPAKADPAKIVQAILQEQVTNSFGSPTLWGRVFDYCHDHRIVLPSLRRVLCAGAPVPRGLWTASQAILPNGRLHSPYGATEALPVSSIGSGEQIALGVEQGVLSPLPAGACVGRPLPEIEVRIIASCDAPIANLSGAQILPSGQVGEIIVNGPSVTVRYDDAPEATARAKIASRPDQNPPVIWHRMGDCGYLDPEGRLWFCGRQAEIVQTAAGPMYTETCEQVFREHPRVARCALIGLGPSGRQQPALVVEYRPKNRSDAAAFAAELRALGRGRDVTAAIRRFYFHPRFPVDVRHNAKIHRLALARWAARSRRYVELD